MWNYIKNFFKKTEYRIVHVHEQVKEDGTITRRFTIPVSGLSKAEVEKEIQKLMVDYNTDLIFSPLADNDFQIPTKG